MIGFFFTTAAPVHASSLGIHPTDSNALLAKRLSTIEVVSNSLNKMELYYDQFWHPYDTWRIQVTLVGTLAMTKDLDTLLQSNFRGSENELASLYFSTILNRFDKTRRFSEKRFSADMSDEGEAQLIKVEFWVSPGREKIFLGLF